jgi:type I restriction enzyme S subunit
MNISNLSNLIEVATSTSNESNYIQSKILDLAFSGSFLPKEIPGPDTWETLRLAEVCEYIQRGKSPKYDEKGEVRVVSQKCVQWSGFNPEHARYIENSTIEKYTQDRFLRDSDILWNSTGSGTVGRTCIFSSHNDQRKYVADSHVTVLRSTRVFPKFLLYWTRSPKIQDRVLGLTTGSTNQQELNLSTIKSLEISIPDLKYQALLANHIDVLITLCEELDICMKASQEVLSKARKSSIDAISTAQTPEELQNSWERIQRNWEVFAGSSESIGDLRGLILTFAASGLLVKQNLSENPPRFDSVSSTKEIPENWIWCELDAIASYGGNGSVSPKSIPKDGWILDLEDIEKSTSRLLVRSFGADRKTTSNKSSFNSGDVLYGKLRPYLDKVLVADMPGFCTTEIVPIRPNDGLDPNWLRICLKRPEFIKKVTELSYGTKMPRLGTNDAKTSVHPIPPLEEQRRIVERVEQLFQICDQLEQDLILSRSLGDKFARSVVSESA